jgi:FkbM family methyltransferase
MLKSLIHKTLAKFQLRLVEIPTKEKLEMQEKERIDKLKNRTKWLRDFGINTIIDIGANTGEFAIEISTILPEAKLISFEPILECFEELKENLSFHKNFKAYHMALGEEASENEIFKNEFTPSSSLLEMANLHKDEFTHTANSVKEKIVIKRLSDVLKSSDIQIPLLIKIDVQGYEGKVIDGGEDIIKSADVIICELSFEKLYEEQVYFDDIYSRFKALGFTYHGNHLQLNSPKNGIPLQCDGIFIKNKGSILGNK